MRFYAFHYGYREGFQRALASGRSMNPSNKLTTWASGMGLFLFYRQGFFSRAPHRFLLYTHIPVAMPRHCLIRCVLRSAAQPNPSCLIQPQPYSSIAFPPYITWPIKLSASIKRQADFMHRCRSPIFSFSSIQDCTIARGGLLRPPHQHFKQINCAFMRRSVST